MERRIRGLKERADKSDELAQVAIDETRASQHDACAKAEVKIRSSEEKIQAAKEAVRQAGEYHNQCHNELNTIRTIYKKGIFAMEKEKRESRSEADAKIQAYQESIDKLDQQMMAGEASSTKDSA